MTWLIIFGTLFAGVTALPLRAELDAVTRILGSDAAADHSVFARWLVTIRDALHATYARYPFIGYGTDWLAFGHIAIGIAFVAALQHPIRNNWLFTWGMVVSVLVIPWALMCGEVRQIPIGWRLIDCSFGLAAFVPCWIAARACRELERQKIAEENF